MQDTFFVDPVETTPRAAHAHRAPCKVRSMLEREVPIYVLCPGAVYRTDEFDATAPAGLHAVRGLVVDRGITMAHTEGHPRPRRARAVRARGQDRFRANFFPFTEPSAELDLWHPTFKGGAR
jgi:phenylalanyl-tRNA synthetase alpha chain